VCGFIFNRTPFFAGPIHSAGRKGFAGYFDCSARRLDNGKNGAMYMTGQFHQMVFANDLSPTSSAARLSIEH
jgi:hypothetical protein